jgi:hypothetical protein
MNKSYYIDTETEMNTETELCMDGLRITNGSYEIIDEIMEEMDDAMSSIKVYDADENYKELSRHHNNLMNIDSYIDSNIVKDEYINEIQRFFNNILTFIRKNNHTSVIDLNMQKLCNDECSSCIIGIKIEKVFKSSNNKQFINRAKRVTSYILGEIED